MEGIIEATSTHTRVATATRGVGKSTEGEGTKGSSTTSCLPVPKGGCMLFFAHTAMDRQVLSEARARRRIRHYCRSSRSVPRPIFACSGFAGRSCRGVGGSRQSPADRWWKRTRARASERARGQSAARSGNASRLWEGVFAVDAVS